MTSILTLPPEIYIKIFEYLSVYDKLKLLSVCRSWRALVNQDKKLWSHLDFSRRVNHTPSLTDSDLYPAFIAAISLEKAFFVLLERGERFQT